MNRWRLFLLRLLSFKVDLTGDVVEDHDDKCGDQLGDSIVDMTKIGSDPHDELVDQKTENRERDEESQVLS